MNTPCPLYQSCPTFGPSVLYSSHKGIMYKLLYIITLISYCNNALSDDKDNYLTPTSTYLSTNFVGNINIIPAISYNIGKHLFVTPADYGRMVTIPSFSPPSSIAIYTVRRKEIAEKYKGEWLVPNSEWEYFLTYTVAEEKFKTKVQNKDEVSILRYDLKISYDLALAVNSAWSAMIRHRYKRHNNLSGLDGISYDFSTRAGTGSTWSPKNGLTFEMVQLGNRLINITKRQTPLSPFEQAEIIQKFQIFETNVYKNSNK